MTTALQLSNLFVQFGRVQFAEIGKDGSNGRSLGFGYIVMDKLPGLSAINALNSIKFMNGYIDVSEASV